MSSGRRWSLPEATAQAKKKTHWGHSSLSPQEHGLPNPASQLSRRSQQQGQVYAFEQVRGAPGIGWGEAICPPPGAWLVLSPHGELLGPCFQLIPWTADEAPCLTEGRRTFWATRRGAVTLGQRNTPMFLGHGTASPHHSRPRGLMASIAT